MTRSTRSPFVHLWRLRHNVSQWLGNTATPKENRDPHSSNCTTVTEAGNPWTETFLLSHTVTYNKAFCLRSLKDFTLNLLHQQQQSFLWAPVYFHLGQFLIVSSLFSCLAAICDFFFYMVTAAQNTHTSKICFKKWNHDGICRQKKTKQKIKICSWRVWRVNSTHTVWHLPVFALHTTGASISHVTYWGVYNSV